MRGASTSSAAAVLLMASNFFGLCAAGFLPGEWAVYIFSLPAPRINKGHVLSRWEKMRTPFYRGPPDYQQYHANDSLIGKPVDCSQQEKLCFRFNMLHDKDLGCVDLSQRNAAFSAGHLVPVLFKDYSDVCDGYKMAYDDRCYRKDVVRDVICGCPTEPTRHFLHGVECRCVPPTFIHVEQPKEDGKCRIPDLRFPDNDRSRFYWNPYEHIQGFTSNQHSLNVTDVPPRFSCSAEQVRCFAQGQVWVRQARACFPLLERGPCAQEHVLTLSGQAALEGYVEAICVHVRAECPPGHVRTLFDGNCHNEEDIKLIANGKVIMNQFGVLLSISNHIRSVKFRPSELLRSTCFVRVEPEYTVEPANVRTETSEPNEIGNMTSEAEPNAETIGVPEIYFQKVNLQSKSLCSNESDITYPESSEPCKCVYV